MKILILTAWYAPFIHPRAHRWTALAKHWASTGHQVQVLTARTWDAPNSTMSEGLQVHRVGFDSLKEWFYYCFRVKNRRGRIGLLPQKPGRFQRVLEWGYKRIWKKMAFPEDACVWYFPAKKKMFQLIDNEHFDLLITVSWPFTGHLLGLAAKKKYPNLFWLADIGDPFSIHANEPNNRRLYHKKKCQFEQKVLVRADAVTVTTSATINAYQKHFGNYVSDKLVVIPPLFHPPQATNARFPLPPGINMGYFGALYAPTRTPDALLLLLQKACKLRPELQDKLTVHFFGEIFPEFFEKLNKPSTLCPGCGASTPARIQLHGLRSRDESWAAMQSMDILVNIGNTTDFQLPSKVAEYLAAGKPILNLSYVANDPFRDFLEDNKLVFNLLVQNQVVSDHQVAMFLNWFERERPMSNQWVAAEKIKPLLVENIANEYLGLCRRAAAASVIR